MSAYFFHVERNGERITDDEGSTLADMQSVQELAIKAAAEIAAEDLKCGMERLEQSILVENEFGQEVVRVNVAASVEVKLPLHCPRSGLPGPH